MPFHTVVPTLSAITAASVAPTPCGVANDHAMSRVRHAPDFPNPILRLGRQDANFKRLVANQTVNQVAAYTKAMRANQRHLEEEKKDTADMLKAAIDQTAHVISLASARLRTNCEPK